MSDERCSLKFNASLLFVIVNRNSRLRRDRAPGGLWGPYWRVCTAMWFVTEPPSSGAMTPFEGEQRRGR